MSLRPQCLRLMEFNVHSLTRNLILSALTLVSSTAFAAQLSSDAKSSIPHDVQQLIVVDYRAMQNSPAAMSLKDRVLPPELKRLETQLVNSGLKVDQDVDVLAFAAFRSGSGDGTRTVGLAQGQFQTRSIMAHFEKDKIKPIVLRNNSIYPMASGAMVAFLNQTTMVFGDRDSVRSALDARDGMSPNFLTNSDLVSEMNSVETHAVWSLLDQRGTQTMMGSALGEASQLADYDTVKNRFRSSRYTMDFQNGVKFNMSVVMSDTITAATVATLMKGAVLLKENTGTPLEKTALGQTTIGSSAGTLSVDYSSSDSQFASLLSSPLFQSVVR